MMRANRASIHIRKVFGWGTSIRTMTVLPDDDALTDVALGAGGLIQVLAPEAIHVSMSTISPGLSRSLSERHQLAGHGYVAAPVLGNPDLAHARKLFVIAAGAAPAVTDGFTVRRQGAQNIWRQDRRRAL